MIEKERVKALAKDKARDIMEDLEFDVEVLDNVKPEEKEQRAESLRKSYGRRILNALYGIGGYTSDPEFKTAWDEADAAGRIEIQKAIRELLVGEFPVLETMAAEVIRQIADDNSDENDHIATESEQSNESSQIFPDLSQLEQQIEQLKQSLNGRLSETIDLFEKLIRLLKAYPTNRPDAAQQRIQAILAQIKIDRIEMVENNVGDHADTLVKILDALKALAGVAPIQAEKTETVLNDYEFKDPGRDDLSAYVAEWKRLWDMAEAMDGGREKFVNLINKTLMRMEAEIGDFMDRAKFSERPVGIRYKALKMFFNNLGYSYNKDSGEFSGKVTELRALYTYLHNRLSLADHFHINGVSGSMFADFKSAVESTIPEFGRYVTDYFLGTAVEPEKRKEKTEVYEHYRLVRVFDNLMTSYYDEMPDGNAQDKDSGGRWKVDGQGNPELTKYKTIYVVRRDGLVAAEGSDFTDLKRRFGGTEYSIEEKYPTLYLAKDGNDNVVASGVSRRDLERAYPNHSIKEAGGTVFLVYGQNGEIIAGGQDKAELEAKYSGDQYLISSSSTLDKEKQQRGYFSFGRAAWMSSGGGYKTSMIVRLKADFAALKGVKRMVKDGEIVYSYTGPQESRGIGKVMEISESKLDEALSVALGINALSATRAEIFTGLYYAIGKSPNDDVNLELMSKCFPLAKELNLTKEGVMEIPYIVLGGDVPNKWLAEGALKIGLCRMILSSKELRDKTGIQNQGDFFKEVTYSVDGVVMRDIKGLVELRELDSSVMTNANSRDRSLSSDFPRFRNILRSIYISRLKRDLLRLKFAQSSVLLNKDGTVNTSQPKSDNPEFRTMPIHAHKRTPAYKSGVATSGDLIRPFVMPPRMVMVEFDEDLDLSRPDMDEPGRTAKDGLQFHSNILQEYDAASKTYEIANQALPSLTGEISKDVEIIVKDLEGLLKQTSLMKKDDKMIDWVYFYELVQMRITRLIFLHREKYNIFQRRLTEPGEKLMGRPIASSSVVHDLRHYIENSGQTGVGGDELIYIPQFGRKVNLKAALLSLIPDENVHHGEDRAKTLGTLRSNIGALFTKEGYNKESLIGQKRVGLYAGGIQQRSMLLEVQGSAYVSALKRYQLVSFLDPDTAVLTNTGLLNTGSATVKSAKESQDKEKEKK